MIIISAIFCSKRLFSFRFFVKYFPQPRIQRAWCGTRRWWRSRWWPRWSRRWRWPGAGPSLDPSNHPVMKSSIKPRQSHYSHFHFFDDKVEIVPASVGEQARVEWQSDHLHVKVNILQWIKMIIDPKNRLFEHKITGKKYRNLST